MYLITRADDAGGSRSANLAILETIRAGVIKNVSVMAPGPYLKEAAEMLRPFAETGQIDLGLHVTLNAEWERVKWKPLLPLNEVASLTDENGFFLPTPQHFQEAGASVSEMIAEAEAQLARLREAGLKISYLDEHMMVGWVGGLAEKLQRLAKQEGLLFHRDVPYVSGSLLSFPEQPPPIPALLDALRGSSGGRGVLVTHPALDTPEISEFYFAGLAPGQVAAERDAERKVLLSPQFRETMEAAGVTFARYTDFAESSG